MNTTQGCEHIVFSGGQSEGPLTSLLRIGEARILLDCGCTAEFDLKAFQDLAKKLNSIGGLDAILISHADISHLGGLPILLKFLDRKDTAIICTLPVFKMGQMMLYDFSLNRGESLTSENLFFSLDDVDNCFESIVTVKYRQTINIPKLPGIKVCSYPSGRTVGGSGWFVRYKATEVLYMVDMNLRKEIVLEGATLNLPSNPSLVIAGGCTSTTHTSRKKKSRDDGLLTSIMQVVRSEGNVLLPCESISRTLELLQLLHKYWIENKLALYHLVFLSPMSHNIIDFAQSQLEWYNDHLSSEFYDGKLNPFSLSKLHLVTTLREMDQLPPGPRVVLATDASLNVGPAKDLLLRWGGDPKNCVIFTDISEPGSLAAEIRSLLSTPPVIATVTRTERVALIGEDLSAYLKAQDDFRRNQEREQQRLRREQELQQLAAGQEEEEMLELYDPYDQSPGTPMSTKSGQPGSLSRQSSLGKRSRDGSLGMFRFATPRFPMFENRDPTESLGVSEYGAGIDDLPFPTAADKINPIGVGGAGGAARENGGAGASSRTRMPTFPGASMEGPALINGMKAIGPEAISADGSNSNQTAELGGLKPYKIVTKRVRIQFTCSFKEIDFSGRSDTKAIRTLLSSVNPHQVIVLHNKPHECDQIVKFATQLGYEASAPCNFETTPFSERGDKVKIEIPLSILKTSGKVISGERVHTGESKNVVCNIAPLSGRVLEKLLISDQNEDSVRVVRWVKKQVVTSHQDIHPDDGENGEQDEDDGGLKGSATQNNNKLSKIDQPLHFVESSSIGAVSVGEVLLDNIRQHLDRSSISTEYRLSGSGGYLLCAGQVILRKEQENDFLIEGVPSPAFYNTRAALYERFTFI